MKAAVIVFPGSNCDRDIHRALQMEGAHVSFVWHRETALPPALDLLALPGGFAFGDYLRSGAMAARAPVMREVLRFAAAGGMVLGVCNGFQVLVEAGLLPGGFTGNITTRFMCRSVHVKVIQTDSPYTTLYREGQLLTLPVAHRDGRYVTDGETLRRLEGEGRIAFRYASGPGRPDPAFNPNGSVGAIAGVLSENRRVLGMMPHPERMNDVALGGRDGAGIFAAIVQSAGRGAVVRRQGYAAIPLSRIPSSTN